MFIFTVLHQYCTFVNALVLLSLSPCNDLIFFYLLFQLIQNRPCISEFKKKNQAQNFSGGGWVLPLTLSLQECLMEFCKVTLIFDSADKILWCGYSNKSGTYTWPVLTHGAICFSKFHNMKFGNLVEICFRLNLTVKGLMAYIPNWEAPPERGTFFRLGLWKGMDFKSRSKWKGL